MSYQHTPFGAELPQGAPRPNRRASVRYQCPLATAGRLLLTDRTEYRRAWVIDLSRHGIGLVVTRALPLGQRLVVQLTSPTTGTSFELPALVTRTSTQPDGDCHVGCAFVTPLGDAELDELL
jgi:hypothetical protein